MASIRLRVDQVQKLRQCNNAAEVIRRAIFRWKRGDFVIGSKPKRKKENGILQVFPIWRKPDGVADWQLREILDQHWNIPDEAFRKKLEQDIAKLDKEIEGMFKLLPKYVIEEN